MCYFAVFCKSNVMGWISALASIAGTVASGIGSAIANKKEKEAIEAERGAANAWYNQQIYEDPTKRADYAAMIGELQRQMKAQQSRLDAKNKITGGTEEQANAQRAAQAEQIANVTEHQMANQAKRVDALNSQQRSENIAADKRQADLRARQFETWKNVAGNAANQFGGFEAAGGKPAAEPQGTGANVDTTGLEKKEGEE
mgnify:CR=1 FL=1